MATVVRRDGRVHVKDSWVFLLVLSAPVDCTAP